MSKAGPGRDIGQSLWYLVLHFTFLLYVFYCPHFTNSLRAFLKIERVLGPESLVINLDNSGKWLKVEILIWNQ